LSVDFWLGIICAVTSRLKIYQFAHSPFCIAVTQAVRSVGIEPELVDVSNADRSAIVRLTGGAYYQVPVLADDERLVYESGSDSQDIAAKLSLPSLNERGIHHRGATKCSSSCSSSCSS
jgi:hypothetical protein